MRVNKNGKLFLVVYGKASAVHIDPIEKKPLYHFLPGQEAFSIGTVGCNFGCEFCQNWNLSQASRILRRKLSLSKKKDQLGLKVSKYGYELDPPEVVDICVKKQIPIIAYTYNEPVIFFEYLYECAVMASQVGIRNIFVSNGYESKEALDQIGPYLHGINVDLKAFRDKFYRKTCKARLQPVLDTILELNNRGIWLEITTLLIPGENDSEEELTGIARFIALINKDIPWHISRFHPDYKMTNKPVTPIQSLLKAYEIGKSEGLSFVYVGNCPSLLKEDTHCPNCDHLLIRRKGYQIEMMPSFQNGNCLNCQTKIAGVWK